MKWFRKKSCKECGSTADVRIDDTFLCIICAEPFLDFFDDLEEM